MSVYIPFFVRLNRYADFIALILITEDTVSKTDSINLLKPSGNYMYQLLQF
jgi:hypothetical protein